MITIEAVLKKYTLRCFIVSHTIYAKIKKAAIIHKIRIISRVRKFICHTKSACEKNFSEIIISKTPIMKRLLGSHVVYFFEIARIYLEVRKE